MVRQQKLSVILVTYNRVSLLDEALANLDAMKEDFDIHVIDNASTDSTAELLQEWKKKANKEIIIHRLNENLGGAGGFSYGMLQAAKAGSDLFWLMDDDTMVNECSLQPLLQAVKEHPEASFFSSRALWTDGTDHRMNAQRKMEKDTGQRKLKIREATFVSLLVPRQQVEQKGLPIGEFFIWGDDIEYTRRLSQNGYGLLIRDSEVLHKTATNVGSDISRDEPERLGRYYYAYRNEVFMARKEGLYRSLRQIAKILYHSGKVLAFSDQKGKRLKMIWSSSKAGLGFNPEIPHL